MEFSRRNDELQAGKTLPGAWHHRGPGRNPGKLPLIENCPTKAAQSGPRWSHCKLEELLLESGSCTPVLAREDRSRLLDAYEIKMITTELSQYIESTRSKFRARVCPGHGQTRYEQSQQSLNMNNSTEKYKKLLKGFWIGPAVVCGTSSEGVVTPAARFHGHRPNHKAPASGHKNISWNWPSTRIYSPIRSIT